MSSLIEATHNELITITKDPGIVYFSPFMDEVRLNLASLIQSEYGQVMLMLPQNTLTMVSNLSNLTKLGSLRAKENLLRAGLNFAGIYSVNVPEAIKRSLIEANNLVTIFYAPNEYLQAFEAELLNISE